MHTRRADRRADRPDGRASSRTAAQRARAELSLSRNGARHRGRDGHGTQGLRGDHRRGRGGQAPRRCAASLHHGRRRRRTAQRRSGHPRSGRLRHPAPRRVHPAGARRPPSARASPTTSAWPRGLRRRGGGRRPPRPARHGRGDARWRPRWPVGAAVTLSGGQPQRTAVAWMRRLAAEFVVSTTSSAWTRGDRATPLGWPRRRRPHRPRLPQHRRGAAPPGSSRSSSWSTPTARRRSAVAHELRVRQAAGRSGLTARATPGFARPASLVIDFEPDERHRAEVGGEGDVGRYRGPPPSACALRRADGGGADRAPAPPSHT